MNDMSFSLDHCVRGRSRLGGGLAGRRANFQYIGQVDAAQSLEFEGAGVGARSQGDALHLGVSQGGDTLRLAVDGGMRLYRILAALGLVAGLVLAIPFEGHVPLVAPFNGELPDDLAALVLHRHLNVAAAIAGGDDPREGAPFST